MMLLFAFAGVTLCGQATVQNNPVGNWNASAPYAPEGFQVSKASITKVDDKLKVEMNFEEMGYKLYAEQVSFVEGVLKFSFYIEGEDVVIRLKFNGLDKLEGQATTSMGDIPLVLTRIKPVVK